MLLTLTVAHDKNNNYVALEYKSGVALRISLCFVHEFLAFDPRSDRRMSSTDEIMCQSKVNKLSRDFLHAPQRVKLLRFLQLFPW